MTKQLPYEIQIDYLENGKFLIYATHLEQKKIKALLTHWRPLFFAWHHPSYYGTSFEEMNEGVVLSSWETMELYSGLDSRRSLFTFSYSSPVKWLQKWAPVIFEKIKAGQFMPDFEQWTAGKFGWKLIDGLQNIDEESSIFTHEFLSEWISSCITEFIENDKGLRSLWDELTKKYPLLLNTQHHPASDSDDGKVSLVTGNFFNEELWLERIGWMEDLAPFTVELRLSEPLEYDNLNEEIEDLSDRSLDGELEIDEVRMPPENTHALSDKWTLDILLRDKTNPSHWYVWEPNKSGKYTATIPAEWHGFLHKITRCIELTCQIVPWLKASAVERSDVDEKLPGLHRIEGSMESRLEGNNSVETLEIQPNLHKTNEHVEKQLGLHNKNENVESQTGSHYNDGHIESQMGSHYNHGHVESQTGSHYNHGHVESQTGSHYNHGHVESQTGSHYNHGHVESRVRLHNDDGHVQNQSRLQKIEERVESQMNIEKPNNPISIAPSTINPAAHGIGDIDIIHTLTEEQAWTFLTEASIQLAEAGIDVLLPSWWQEIRALNPKLKIQLRSSVGTSQQSLLSFQAISDFDWKIATGNTELDEKQFLQYVEENRRLVKVNGKWMKLDPAFIKQVKHIMSRVKKEGLSFQDILAQELLSLQDTSNTEELDLDNPLSQIQIRLNKHFEKLLYQLHHISSLPTIEVPTSFKGKLRAYQKQGVEWLLFLRKFGFGACLADDMGLGKTVQMITYFLYVKEHEKPQMPALIICPTSVLGNWQKELEKFAPSLKVYLHYGSARKKGDELRTLVEDYDIVITTYGLAAIDEDDLKTIEWSTICIDEAQNIKNAYTKQSRAIRSLRGHHHIALTGTPIENRLTELWTIFDFINKGYLGSLNSFSKRFVIPIEKNKNDTRRIQQVQQLVKPFLLRRTKTDETVQLNLPDKLEQKEYIPLTVEQASLYEQLLQDTFDRIEKLSAMERRGLILSMLTKLKQICNHPALYLKDASWEKSLVDRSNKMKKMMELLENILDQKESCLIFTQYVGMGKMIQHAISETFQETVHFLQGTLKKQERDEIIESFQAGNEKLLILSLKAGGTGLNLTAANHVIHFDRWWNPAVENQATDRAYRIGQKRFVHVHKLITTGTLEEKIDEMIEKKKALSDEIISGESWITELSTEELRDLFALRKGWNE
ncbi:DEAD/DEAH box helicase [Calidifontibacillus erzurumensis]|uniref:DEAD/DEAH box helicase n=1 Tax=Calidifontibacillus erzurumensis TaxID=2741433 RepID=UPI001E2D3C05